MNAADYSIGLDPTDPPSIQRLRIENRVLGPVRRRMLVELHGEVTRNVTAELRERLQPLINALGEAAVMPIAEKMLAEYLEKSGALIEAVESSTPQLQDMARPVVDGLFMAIVD